MKEETKNIIIGALTGYAVQGLPIWQYDSIMQPILVFLWFATAVAAALHRRDMP